jgi:hypothetical protein
MIIQPARSTITLTDLPGSPHEEVSWAEINVTRKLRCAWATRHTAGKELLGYVSGNILYLPQEYQPTNSSEEWQNVFCHKIEIDGLGDDRPGIDASTGDYTYAVITAYYSTTEYNTQTLVTESLEPSTNFLTISTEGLTWQGDGVNLATSEAPYQMVPLVDWVYTLHQIDTLPDAYYDRVGCVNATPIYSQQLGRWFAAETLLCNAPVVDREITNWGAKLFKVTFRFTYLYNGVSADGSPAGWNHFPRHTVTQSAISWERVCDSSANWRYFYPTANFWDIIV